MFGSKSSSLSLQSLFTSYHRQLHQQFHTSTQIFLMKLIFNEQTQVLTTFDMNQIASFTFNSKVCMEIFECIEYALTHPIEFTVLSLTKTLVLVHHLAIYASPQAANQVWMLKADIEQLTQYNTVLYALKDKQSILAKMNRIKGGAVDRGLPVRQAALQIHTVLQDVTLFRQLRTQSQDPDSLVPIGSKEHVGFVSDEVRKGILEDQIKAKQTLQTKDSMMGKGHKSLQMGGGGYGAGLVGSTGNGNGNTTNTVVVGAAYTMEDMIHIAMDQSKETLERKQIKQDGYRDNIDHHDNDALTLKEKQHLQHLEQLKEEWKIQNANKGVRRIEEQEQQQQQQHSNPNLIDLLDDHQTPSMTPQKDTMSSSLSSTTNMLPYDANHNDHYSYTEQTTEEPLHDILGISTVSTSTDMAPDNHTTTTFRSAAEVHSKDHTPVDLLSMMSNVNMNDTSHRNTSKPFQSSLSSHTHPFDAFDVISSPTHVSTNLGEDLPVVSDVNVLMGGVANSYLPSSTISNMTSSPPPLPTCAPPLPPTTEGCNDDSFIVVNNSHDIIENGHISNLSSEVNQLMTAEQLQDAMKTMSSDEMQEIIMMQQKIMMKMMQQNKNE